MGVTGPFYWSILTRIPVFVRFLLTKRQSFLNIRRLVRSSTGSHRGFRVQPTERYETTMSLPLLRGRELKPPSRPDRSTPASGKLSSETVPRIGGARKGKPVLRFPVNAE